MEANMDVLRRLIPTGRSNAVSASTLTTMLGCGSARNLRAMVNQARRNGVPICSDDSGYFLPGTKDEADRCIERLRTHGAEEIKMARSIEKSVYAIDGQIQFDADRCVCCGAIVPEGRMVCKNCEKDVI